MSSGIYSALSGAILRMSNMDTITDNLGNAKTAGFKKGQTAFEAVLTETRARTAGKGINFSKLKEGFSDFSQGTILRTGIPLHLAINGNGFFKVRDEAGNVFYTRQGNFKLGPGNVMTTSQNMQVLDEDEKPIVLTSPSPEIDENGFIQLGDGEGKRIPLYAFAENVSLQRQGGSLFFPGAGEEPRLAENVQVLQGQMEESNVNTVEEMAFMMQSLRAFEACQGAIKRYSELSSKAREIGSL